MLKYVNDEPVRSITVANLRNLFKDLPEDDVIVITPVGTLGVLRKDLLIAVVSFPREELEFFED